MSKIETSKNSLKMSSNELNSFSIPKITLHVSMKGKNNKIKQRIMHTQSSTFLRNIIEADYSKNLSGTMNEKEKFISPCIPQKTMNMVFSIPKSTITGYKSLSMPLSDSIPHSNFRKKFEFFNKADMIHDLNKKMENNKFLKFRNVLKKLEMWPLKTYESAIQNFDPLNTNSHILTKSGTQIFKKSPKKSLWLKEDLPNNKKQRSIKSGNSPKNDKHTIKWMSNNYYKFNYVLKSYNDSSRNNNRFLSNMLQINSKISKTTNELKKASKKNSIQLISQYTQRMVKPKLIILKRNKYQSPLIGLNLDKLNNIIVKLKNVRKLQNFN